MLTVFVRSFVALIALLLIAAGGLYLHSPPQALDVLNDLFPGDDGVERAVAGTPFRPGTTLALDVWRPKKEAIGARRVVIFFYGGAWVKGRRQDYGFVAKAYAARGFVVVIPDYRKVPSVHFPTYVEDGAAAVRWVHDNIARYGGDPGRVILAGHSAGGYIAMMLALDRHYLADAGLPSGAVRAVVGLAGPYDFYPFDSRRAIDAMGNASDPRITQPVSFARKDAPPMLLMTGLDDDEVRPRNAVSLAARERALGNATTALKTYSAITHTDLIMALSKPFRGKGPVLDDSIAFMNQVTRCSSRATEQKCHSL